MAKQVPPAGPIPARIMIVGEAPGADEEARGEPFCGVSGMELNRMLSEAGIARSECFVTNVCRIRPPKNDIELFLRKPFAKGRKLTKEDEKKIRDGIDPHKFVPFRDKLVHPAVLEGFNLLQKEISVVTPNIIIAVGNVAMWALTGKWGITKWRGSMLTTDAQACRRNEHLSSLVLPESPPCSWKVIPTYHPSAILRQWDWRAVGVSDLRRAARFRDGTSYPTPGWNFIIRPSYAQVISTLHMLLVRADFGERLKLSHDIETRAGHIACIGISWSRRDAICIPLMSVKSPEGYWSLDGESEIVKLLSQLLTHRNVEVIGQNHAYDSQYTDRHFFFVPRLKCDTMIGQHALFSDMPKALYFIASLYCDYYVYWKDEGKNWDPSMGEDQFWQYNCLDCVYTYEVAEVEEALAEQLGLKDVFAFQQRMHWPVLQTMLRGVRIDQARRNELILEVQLEIDRRQEFLQEVLGFALNPDSPKQMHTLFYEDFQLPVQMKRGKKGEPSRPTLDDDALQKLAVIEPLVSPIVSAVADIRTLGKFLSNFLCRALDIDGRMRCSYNIGGSESGKSAPKTYRLSSSESAFGCGTNLQNIPSEKSTSVGKAAKRAKAGGLAVLGDPYQFPNIREIFIPDPGYTWWDLDLERADLYVFVWEIDDTVYKEFLRSGVDAHLFHGFLLDGKEPPPNTELIEGHAKEGHCTHTGTCYWTHRERAKYSREFAKKFTHAVDYVGGSVTISKALNRTVREVDRARKIYLATHPKIEPYWKAVEAQIKRYHFVENKFGYRWYIFGRVEQALSEAVAWVPQSTVSIVINRVWERIYSNLPDVQILLQVHDSLCGQTPNSLVQTLLPRVRECALVTVPYPDPLIIPISMKSSEKSWGHC